MHVRSCALVAVCAVFLLARSTGRAQPAVEFRDEPAAKAAFAAGREAYDDGRFAEALGHYERAYELSGRSALLFNIARAAEQEGMHERALRTYEQYLRALPDATNRTFVEGRIKKLRELTVARGSPTPGKPASPPPPRDESDAPRPTVEPRALEVAPATPDDHTRQSSLERAVQLGGTVPLVVYAKPKGGSSSLEWGPSLSFTLELGYALTERVVLGGVLALAGRSFTATSYDSQGTVEEYRYRSLAFAIGPKLDVMFVPSARVQPLVGCNAQLLRAKTRGAIEDISRLGVGLSARAGVRGFVSSGFSVDPALALAWSFLEPSTRTFQVGLQLGFSGWILR